MIIEEIELSEDAFDKAEIEAMINQADSRRCIDYLSLFLQKEKEAELSGNIEKQNWFKILYCIVSLHLKPDEINEPFGPFAVLENRRSSIVDDFTDKQLAILERIADSIIDHELRARIFDVLWVTKRKYRCAQLAIESYLESAKLLEDPKKWTQCDKRINRATNLAKSLGRNPCLSKVINHIKDVIAKYNGTDPLFLSYNMMNLLLDCGVKDEPQKYSDISEKLAKNAEASENWYVARRYWKMKSKWDSIIDDNKSKESIKLAAETYVKEAIHSISKENPSYTTASVHLQSAIVCLRKTGGYKDRINEIHQLLLEYQSKSTSELQTISTEIDLAEIVKNVQEQIRGKTLYEALKNLALLFISPNVDRLRKQVMDNAKTFIVQSIFPQTAVNQHGHVIGRAPSMMSDDPEEVEQAIRTQMLNNAQLERQINIQIYAEPIRKIINQEHRVKIADFLPLVMNNPFVPPGREYIYAHGLYAGLIGDFLTCVHLLVPQIENSIRYLLIQHKCITSGFSSTGIQDERPLTTTIYLSELTEILGKDVVFDLQGLLVERFGHNLRNRMAHGLMSHNMFYAVESLYLWWFILKICFTPIIKLKNDYEQIKVEAFINRTKITHASNSLFLSELNYY